MCLICGGGAHQGAAGLNVFHRDECDQPGRDQGKIVQIYFPFVYNANVAIRTR